MARTITCACGHDVTAANDEGLVSQLRQHLTDDHPDLQVPDEALQAQVATDARDAAST